MALFFVSLYYYSRISSSGAKIFGRAAVGAVYDRAQCGFCGIARGHRPDDYPHMRPVSNVSCSMAVVRCVMDLFQLPTDRMTQFGGHNLVQDPQSVRRTRFKDGKMAPILPGSCLGSLSNIVQQPSDSLHFWHRSHVCPAGRSQTALTIRLRLRRDVSLW